MFAVQDHDYTDYIDLLAYGKHMFWLQPSEETTRSTWGKWESQMNTHVRYFPSVNWEDMMSYHPEIEKPPPLSQCKHCSMCAKSVSTPESFYDINGVSFDSSDLAVPEFRAGGWNDANHLPDDFLDLTLQWTSAMTMKRRESQYRIYEANFRSELGFR